MERNGKIVNEFGEQVGSYWFRIWMNAWSFIWLGCRFNGYTLEGIAAWANRLGYHLEND